MKKVLAVIFIIVIICAYFLYKNLGRNNINIIPITKSDKSDLIVVITPVKDSLISSPLSITGRARGQWFFEGSFPIILLDNNRNVIAEGHVTAQGEWTTENFVKFVGSLQFTAPAGDNGFLVLKKDNPSGITQNDDSIEIPILFHKK